MWHHAGLSSSFWIYAVKAKLHTYNVTPIKRADYKTPTALWSTNKPNISHLRVFGCQAWVHILKKRRHKLALKSQEMIFVGYKPGSKGYQFWDTAHQHIEISRDVKFNETLFPVKEAIKNQASENDLPISESDNESDTMGLELLIPGPTSLRPSSPSQSALRPIGSQSPTHPNHPLPHQLFNQARNLPDHVNHLLDLKSQHHNIPYVLQKSVGLAKPNPLEKILMQY